MTESGFNPNSNAKINLEVPKNNDHLTWPLSYTEACEAISGIIPIETLSPQEQQEIAHALSGTRILSAEEYLILFNKLDHFIAPRKVETPSRTTILKEKILKSLLAIGIKSFTSSLTQITPDSINKLLSNPNLAWVKERYKETTAYDYLINDCPVRTWVLLLASKTIFDQCLRWPARLMAEEIGPAIMHQVAFPFAKKCQEFLPSSEPLSENSTVKEVAHWIAIYKLQILRKEDPTNPQLKKSHCEIAKGILAGILT